MARLKSHHSKLRNWLYLFLGTVVTVVLLAWVLKDVSPSVVWESLKQAKLEWLFLGWVAYLASYWVRARRWGTLLAADFAPGRFRTRLAALFIGFGANSVLPAYAGEFIRAAVLYRLDQVPFEAAVGSVFVERLLDIGIVFLFLLLPLWLGALPHSPALNGVSLGWLGAVLVMIWAAFVIGASFPDKIAQLVGTMSQKIGLGHFKPRIVSAVTGFLAGLGALRQPTRTLVAVIETAIIWGLNGITYWSGLVAFGIASPGFLGALFTQSATAFAIALPSTPGYIGSFEAGIRFSLGIYSIPVDTIIAYAVALRFLMYVTIPVIAAVIVARLGLSKSDLTQAEAAESGASSDL